MGERHYLIVGGTRGIGLALVKHLLSNHENSVSVLGRRSLGEFSDPRLRHYVTDVMNRDALVDGLDRAVQCFGELTCAIFLQRHRGDKSKITEDLGVALVATKDAIDHLVERKSFSSDGNQSIVLVSSVADRYVAAEQPLGYHLGKAGLSHLARYYAVALGPKGIRVNSVSPCVVAKQEAKAYYDENKWLVDRYEASIPLGRMGRPEDIVKTIMFLAGEDASYITGQNIVVDGGLTLLSHESLIRDFPRLG